MEPLRSSLPKQLDVSLHRDPRHPQSFHDRPRLHRPVDDHRACEHPETPNVFFLVVTYGPMAVDVSHLPFFHLYGDAAIDFRYPGGEYWQLSLWHSAF